MHLNTNMNILFQGCFSLLYVLMKFHPFLAHGIAPECGASDIRHKSIPNEHNLRQEKLNSTVMLYSDQPTHGIAPECGTHLLGIQNAQSKSLWHLTEKGNKSKFHYVSKLQKLSYSKIRQFCNQLILIDA